MYYNWNIPIFNFFLLLVFVLFCIVIINANTLKSVGDNTADAAIGGKDDHVDKAHKVEDSVGSTKDTSGELPGIHDRVNRDVEDALDKTKETTGEAWDKTKETTGEALDKTKEKTGN